MTREEIGFMPLAVLVLSLLLSAATGLVAQEDSGSDVTLKLRGGMITQCKLLTPSVAVETDYGTLNVPTDQILVLYHGLRTDGDGAADVKKLVDDLGNDVFDVREKAQKALIQIGTPAIPLLKEAANSDDAEVAERAAAALEAIGTGGAATATSDDTLVTKRFTIVGRITTKEYEIASPLGTMKVAVEKVEKVALRPLNVPTVMLPAKLNTISETEPTHWKCSLTEEAGWTGAAFDDTAWVLPTSHNGLLTCPELKTGQTCCLRRSFILDTPPTSATLTIQANACEAYVNGVSLGRGQEGVHDMVGLLRQGINVVAIKAVGYDSRGYSYACSVALDIK